MRRLARPPLTALVTATVLGACNTLSGLDDDYVVGIVPQSADAGRRDTGDGRLPDGSSSGFDSGTVTTPGCPAGALFCDDFEDGSKIAPHYGWDKRDTIGGVPNVEAAIGFNGTRGLHATATGTGGSARVSLWKTVAPTLQDGKRLTVTFAFKIASAGIDYAVIGAIQLNGLDYGIAVYRNAGCPGAGVCIDENDPSGGHSFAGAKELIVNQWYRADISVVRTGGGYGGRVVLDKGTTLDDRSTGALPGETPATVEIGIGAFYTGPSGVTETFVDDVVVRED